MSYTQIKARIIDQSLRLSNVPVLASGGKNEVQIVCEFCTLWDKYVKTAVFYRDGGDIFHRPLTDNTVVVPYEVMNDKGAFFFGIFGVKENTRTTEVVRLNVVQGAISIATASPSDPTPDIYSQILASYENVAAALAVEKSRLNELTAMRSSGGITEYEMEGEIEGTIISSGTAAHVMLYTASSITLEPSGNVSYDCIPPQYAPLGSTSLRVIGPEFVIASIYTPDDSENGYARLTVTNIGNESVSEYFEFDGVYSLASVAISELADVRIGADGHEYSSAGEAVREQIRKLPSSLQAGIDTIKEGLGNYIAFKETIPNSFVSANGTVTTNAGTYTNVYDVGEFAQGAAVTIKCHINTAMFVAIFGENETKLGHYTTTGSISEQTVISFEIPAGTRIIKTSDLTSKASLFEFSFEPAFAHIDNKISQANDKKKTFRSKNLLSTYEATDEAITSDGTLGASSWKCTTDYLKVDPDKTIITSRLEGSSRIVMKMNAVAFYDADKAFISANVASSSATPDEWLSIVRTPFGCEYVRITYQKLVFTQSYRVMLEYGNQINTSINAYEPYFDEYTTYGQKEMFADKKLCVFGDSLAADGIEGHDSWGDRIGNILGFKEVYNRGIGGSAVCDIGGNGNPRSAYAYIDSNGYARYRTQYSTQQTVPSGFTEINSCMCLPERTNTIPLDTDILIIWAGINDFLDTTNVSEERMEVFKADYSTMLDNIIARVPDAKILIANCSYYYNGDHNYKDNLTKHRNVIREIANDYGIKLIELRAEMGVNEKNYTQYMDSLYLHFYPEKGRTRVVETILPYVCDINYIR